MDVIQIVPRLPPATDGVGDYAIRVACELRNAHQIESHFVVGDPGWHGDTNIDFHAERLVRRSCAALVEALQRKASIPVILLNYVGYGYARRGCPIWLVKGLVEWARVQRGALLVTIFHELYAFGLPWASSFWTSPLQKHLAKTIALLSHQLITPMVKYAQVLKRFGVTSQVIELPVFSNVGEIAKPRPLAERKPQMVVFGNSARRSEVYTCYRHQLLRACRLLDLEVIVDVGAPMKNEPELPLAFTKKGEQTAKEITSLLSESRAGFLAYYDGYLAKSGVFAAYCAHGILPVLPARNESQLDGIRNGQEYLIVNETPTAETDISYQQIASGAHHWYQKHSVAKTVSKLAEALKRTIK